MQRSFFACAATVIVFSLTSALAEQTVTDGDTIKLNGTTYRLWGIDAPEAKQTCADGWPAGAEAKHALEQLMADKAIACEARGHDRYRRTIGLCRADGEDLQAAMVRSGMAWAFTRYSSDYVLEEKAAIGERLGVHAHDCEKAWDWRAERRGQ
jgi:endonuclease YncB( thermonuclease family)